MKDMEKVPKNRWVRLIRKKWFLPALYVTIAGLILSAVVWHQAIGNPWMKSSDMRDEIEQKDDAFAGDFDEEAESVLQQQETIQMPIDDEVDATIVTNFFDYEAEEKEQEKGLTLYNNRYYQSTGIDIAEAKGDPFDVVASLSGTVLEVKEDPLLGNVVTISHSDSITTHYASLSDVTVDAGEKIAQGDKLGTAGTNMFNESSGTHVHFEIHKDGIEVDPEQFFNKEVSKLEAYDVEVIDLEDDDHETDADEAEDEEAETEDKTDEDTPTTPKDDDKESKGTNEDVSFSITA